MKRKISLILIACVLVSSMSINAGVWSDMAANLGFGTKSPSNVSDSYFTGVRIRRNIDATLYPDAWLSQGRREAVQGSQLLNIFQPLDPVFGSYGILCRIIRELVPGVSLPSSREIADIANDFDLSCIAHGIHPRVLAELAENLMKEKVYYYGQKEPGERLLRNSVFRLEAIAQMHKHWYEQETKTYAFQGDASDQALQSKDSRKLAIQAKEEELIREFISDLAAQYREKVGSSLRLQTEIEVMKPLVTQYIRSLNEGSRDFYERFLPSASLTWNPLSMLKEQYRGLWKQDDVLADDSSVESEDDRVSEASSEVAENPEDDFGQPTQVVPPSNVPPAGKLVAASPLILNACALLASAFEYSYKVKKAQAERSLAADSESTELQQKVAFYTKRSLIASRLRYLFGTLAAGGAGYHGLQHGRYLKSHGRSAYEASDIANAAAKPLVFAVVGYGMRKVIDRSASRSKNRFINVVGGIGHLVADAVALLYSANAVFTATKMQ